MSRDYRILRIVVGLYHKRNVFGGDSNLIPLRLFLRFGRAVQKLDRTLWMNARQRINGMMADRTAFLIRINDRGVAIRRKNHGDLVCEPADGSFGELAQTVLRLNRTGKQS